MGNANPEKLTELQRAVREALDAAGGTPAERLEAIKREAHARGQELKAAADKAHRDEEQAKQDAHLQRGEEKLKAEALRAWTRNGGKAEEFEVNWPSIKLEMLKKKIVDAATDMGPRRRLTNF